MSFQAFSTGYTSLQPLTLPAQTPVPTTPSAEQPVPDALTSGSHTVSTVSPHSALASPTTGSVSEINIAAIEKKFTKEFSRAIELGNSQAAAALVEELTTRFPEAHEVAVILIKCDRICLDQFRDHDTLQIRDQIEKSLGNYRDKVMPDPHPAVRDYFYRKMHNDELTRITADALDGDHAFQTGSKPPSPRSETLTPTPSVEPQSSPKALEAGGAGVFELPAHADAEITAKTFNDKWGFAGIRITSDLKEVSFEPSYSTRAHGMAVVDEINGWLLDPQKPLGPIVALLELVAEKAQEQNAQEMLEPLREQVRDIVVYHSSSKDVAIFQRARVLEANLPDSLRP